MRIDLNADIGEGFDDKAIIPWISSANISCGAHAGTEQQIRQAIQLCKKAGVAIGAHPSYPDKTNFGRQVLAMPATELFASLKAQLLFFSQLCQQEGVMLSHIKAHGALYNQAAKDKQTATVLLDVMLELMPQLQQNQPAPIALMVLSGSMLSDMAKQRGINVIREAFADRAYQADGSLVPRSEAGALLDVEAAISQSLRICQRQPLPLASGEIYLQADSLCLHGDSAAAVELAHQLHLALRAAGVTITAARSAH
jgi:UPF0271 protein